MKISDHAVERYAQRAMKIRDLIENEMRAVLDGIEGVLYKDSRYGWRIAKPVETGIFICNKESTAVITFISKDGLSQKELRDIYRRR